MMSPSLPTRSLIWSRVIRRYLGLGWLSTARASVAVGFDLGDPGCAATLSAVHPAKGDAPDTCCSGPTDPTLDRPTPAGPPRRGGNRRRHRGGRAQRQPTGQRRGTHPAPPGSSTFPPAARPPPPPPRRHLG